MKHAPNGREERKTARDGTQGPMQEISQGRGPKTHERKKAMDGTQGPMKARAVPTASKVVV